MELEALSRRVVETLVNASRRNRSMSNLLAGRSGTSARRTAS